jgi:hypothetical protein
MCPLSAPGFQGFFLFSFLIRPLTVLMKQIRQAGRTIKQSIFLRCLWFEAKVYATNTTRKCIYSLPSQVFFLPKWKNVKQSETVFTIFHFHRNLRMGPISKNYIIRSWKGLPGADAVTYWSEENQELWILTLAIFSYGLTTQVKFCEFGPLIPT